MIRSRAPFGTVTTTVPEIGSTYQDRTLPALEPVARRFSSACTAFSWSAVKRTSFGIAPAWRTSWAVDRSDTATTSSPASS